MKQLFIANISMETRIHDLNWLFSSEGSVESVQLFEDPYSNETKQYAIVKMRQNLKANTVYSLIHNRFLKGNIIIVLPAYTFGREYIHILYELKSLLSRDDTANLKDAANFLIELESVNKQNFCRSKKILLKAIRESALENQLNVDNTARIIKIYLGPSKQRIRKRRRSRSVRAISTPMGGQPPRKRR